MHYLISIILYSLYSTSQYYLKFIGKKNEALKEIKICKIFYIAFGNIKNSFVYMNSLDFHNRYL